VLQCKEKVVDGPSVSGVAVYCSALQCVVQCVVQCVAVCCSVLQCVFRKVVDGSSVSCVAACRSVLQCFAVCCAVCYTSHLHSGYPSRLHTLHNSHRAHS